MLAKLKTRLRNWLGITALEVYTKAIQAKIDALDELTAMDADIGHRGKCSVILSGVYRGRGYVTFFEMDIHEFEQVVEEYKHRKRQHLVRNIDRPPHFYGSFSLKD